MDPNRVFGVDPKMAEDGRWFDYIDGSRVLVARTNNKKFRAAIQKRLKPYRLMSRVPPDIMDRITCEAMADAILLGWEGFESNGAPLSYSREAVVQLLTVLPDFRDDISALAGNLEDFKRAGDEEAEKNLSSA